MNIRFSLWCALALTCALSLPLNAQTAVQDWKSNPRELVRRAIENENKASGIKDYFMFTDVKRKADGTTETKEMVQTPQLVLGRIVAINGQPLSPDQRKNEESRLNRLISDQEELDKKKKEQQEDDTRARRMVTAIPDAFNFQYTATEESPSGEVAVFKFLPNPNWEAPNRELQVFTGMAGTLKINLNSERLTLMQAQLFKDVNFGWGILGKLYKGGDFLIEQSEVVPNHWDITHMKLHFTGKVLLVKSLNIQQDESSSNFREVAPMSVAQALDKLRELDMQYAKNSSANGGN